MSKIIDFPEPKNSSNEEKKKVVDFSELKNSYRKEKQQEERQQTVKIDARNEEQLRNIFVNTYMKSQSSLAVEDFLMGVTGLCITTEFLEKDLFTNDSSIETFAMDNFIITLEDLDSIIDYGRHYHKLMPKIVESGVDILSERKHLAIVPNSIKCVWCGKAIQVNYIRAVHSEEVDKKER